MKYRMLEVGDRIVEGTQVKLSTGWVEMGYMDHHINGIISCGDDVSDSYPVGYYRVPIKCGIPILLTIDEDTAMAIQYILSMVCENMVNENQYTLLQTFKNEIDDSLTS